MKLWLDIDGFLNWISQKAIHHGICRVFAGGAQIRIDGGQRGIQVTALRDVVHSQNRDIIWNGQSVVIDAADSADGHVVVSAD